MEKSEHPSYETASLPPTKDVQQASSYRLFPSVRALNIVLLFLAALLGNATFSVFNFTIVCMVNATMNGNVTKPMTSCQTDSTIDHAFYNGDIPWSRVTQANLLAAYSWGTLVLTFPMGVLLDRFGARLVLTTLIAVNGLCALLTPVAVIDGGEWPTFVLRFLSGVGVWPCVMFVVSRWIPGTETGLLAGFASSGFSLGAILTNIIAGVFCTSGRHGWTSNYYLWGSLCLAWSVAFFIVFSDDPENHRFISHAERAYILAKRKLKSHGKAVQKFPTPWLRMLTSIAFYAVIVAAFTAGWISYFVADFLPTYVKEVLNFSAENNGFFSALPFLAQGIGRTLFGFFSDKIEARIGRTWSVKMFVLIAFGVPSLTFVGITLLTCDVAYLAILLFTVSQFAYSANYAGLVKSAYYIAPPYVGVVAAIATVVSAISALLVPYLVGFITKGGSVDEWNITLYVSSGVLACGAVLFSVFGSGDVQAWARQDDPEAQRGSVKAEP